jgi:hypothetical protein
MAAQDRKRPSGLLRRAILWRGAIGNIRFEVEHFDEITP